MLRAECEGYRRLEEIAHQVRMRTDFRDLSAVAVVDQVRDMADSYYHALWNILERDEKLVVSQLAQGVVVNPSLKQAARRLLARRILVREPELKLMNESFRRFVREEVPASMIAEWERNEPSSAWQRLKFPLLLGLIAVASFLFVTQKEAFDSAVAVLTAAGLGTTALLKLLTTVRMPGRS